MRTIYLIFAHQVRAFADLTHASKMIGRALIGLIAFLMMAMMWTERFLTWDKFLQGGQDLELSLVALVVFLCLILLLAQKSRQAVACQLALARLIADVSAWTRALSGTLMRRCAQFEYLSFAHALCERPCSNCFVPMAPLRI